MQDKDSSNHIPGSPLRDEAKLSTSLGWDGREVQKEASFMEKTVYFKRWKTNPYKKHFNKSAFLHHVSLPDAKRDKG